MRTLAPALAFALLLGGCAGNRALDSIHPPVVDAQAATVPGCPDWSDGKVNSGEATSANFGCATNSNLAAMLADPADLLHGKSGPASTGEFSTRAVRAWRELGPTGKNTIEKVSPKGGS